MSKRNQNLSNKILTRTRALFPRKRKLPRRIKPLTTEKTHKIQKLDFEKEESIDVFLIEKMNNIDTNHTLTAQEKMGSTKDEKLVLVVVVQNEQNWLENMIQNEKSAWALENTSRYENETGNQKENNNKDNHVLNTTMEARVITESQPAS